ncbi:MAG: c-type cytochrome [Bryobacteraceae bacterium]
MRSRGEMTSYSQLCLSLAASAALFAGSASAAQNSQALLRTGWGLFNQHCAFCHGRDARGGDTGPDLTSSSVVAKDVGGDKIGVVVRNGRPGKGMPSFNFSNEQIAALAAFIHYQKDHAGGRRGVLPSDLEGGDAAAGKTYFYGAGTCSTCHSPTGDLAGIANKYKPLKLLERMLNPKDATAKVTVTLGSGKTISGQLAYLDEFTVGLRDASGQYRSWSTARVKYKVDAPAEAHAKLLGKYTDSDMHNLLAYLETLK